MCAINPRFKKRIIMDFYTAHPTMTESEFEDKVFKHSLNSEQRINEDASIRIHVRETDQQAD